MSYRSECEPQHGPEAKARSKIGPRIHIMAREQGSALFAAWIRGRDTVGGRISVVGVDCNGAEYYSQHPPH